MAIRDTSSQCRFSPRLVEGMYDRDTLPESLGFVLRLPLRILFLGETMGQLLVFSELQPVGITDLGELALSQTADTQSRFLPLKTLFPFKYLWGFMWF